MEIGRKSRNHFIDSRIMRVETGRTTSTRRVAVREAAVSRQHGGPIEGPPETPRTSQHCRIQGFKGRPSIASPLCRETQIFRTDIRLTGVVFPVWLWV